MGDALVLGKGEIGFLERRREELALDEVNPEAPKLSQGTGIFHLCDHRSKTELVKFCCRFAQAGNSIDVFLQPP